MVKEVKKIIPFLEECIQSVMNQKLKSKVLIATSTPNAYIKGLAEKYALPLYVNMGDKGIAQDWNFAYAQANTDYVTIAHQDDVYLPHYTEDILSLVSDAKKPLIAFTDYGELRNGEAVLVNKLLKIKRLLLPEHSLLKIKIREGICFWMSYQIFLIAPFF